MSDDDLDRMTADTDRQLPEDATHGEYRPVFDPTVRTIIYVVCLLAQIVSVVCLAYHYEKLGTTIATCAGLLAASFGVAYNPSRNI